MGVVGMGVGVAPWLPALQGQAAFHAGAVSPDLEEAGPETPPGSPDTSLTVANGDDTPQGGGSGPKVARCDEWVEVSLPLTLLEREITPSPGPGGRGP